MKKRARPPAAARERRSPTPSITPSALPAATLPGAATTSLWAWLAALVVARAVAAAVPSMWAWSLNLQRFLDPWSGWGLWTLAAAALIPALATRATSTLESVGDWASRHPGLAWMAAAAGAAGLAFLAPDHVHFVGDFLLREGTLREQVKAQAWYPQAMPLDLAIHAGVAHRLMLGLGVSPNAVGRLIGIVEAGALGALAVRLARVIGLRGAVSVATSAVAFWGGYLTLFTGYNKAFSEMVVVTAATGVFGLECVRHRRGFLGLGVTVALALLIHRSALGLLPATALVWALRLRARDGALRPADWFGAALPLGVLAAMMPQIAGIVTRVDAAHFTPEEVRTHGLLAATFGAARVADLANLSLMLSPLALALPAFARFAIGQARREALFLGALAIPFVAITPFVHPGQGYFRDWDDFAAAGVALSIASAWAVAMALAGAPRRAWLAVTVCVGVAVPSLQWMAHQADLERGLARASAFLREPPARPRMERYTTWKFLGTRYATDQRFAEAAGAFSHAAEAISSTHILHEWAGSEMSRENYSGARTVYQRIVSADPRDTFAWWGLAVAASHVGDWATAQHAARQVVALDSTHAEARQALRDMEQAQPEPATTP